MSKKAKGYVFFIVPLIILSALLACNPVSDQLIILNQEEKLWLKQHENIVLAVDNTYAPLNFKGEDGELTGLNIDLVHLMEQRIGIKIKLEGSNWNEALNKAMNHEVDGLINASPLEERKSKLNFTNEFFKDPLALVTYKGNEIRSFENIKFQRIAAKKGSQHLHLLKSKIPQHLIISINTLDEGIDLLSTKRIDGIYDDLAPLYHIISSMGYSNLKVAFVEPNKVGARIAVRNDDLILLGILNKAIKSISSEERLRIQNKWLAFTPKRDYTVYYITIGILVAVVLLISLWTWSLTAMVKRRTTELEEELVRRKEAEVQLIRSKEKAEESDRLKSAFLANISHEIRTPMNSIFGFSELLQVNDFSREEQSKYLSLILSSAKQLLSIINDLVNISKLEANLVTVDKSKVDVTKMMEDLKSIFKLETKNQNIELSYECTINGTSHFNIDEVKVKQVLTNLISNSIKNTEKGFVNFGIKHENSHLLQFYVKDSGTGINPDDHKNIFNRFWKVNNGSNESGTGLGLAISKAHVELMGGEIWVESKLGDGAAFYFTIAIE